MATFTRGRIKRKRSPFGGPVFDSATFTLTDETVNARTVTIQLKQAGAVLAEVANFRAYLSDASTGIGVAASAPTGNVVIGASGAIAHLITDKVFMLVTSATGAVAITITESTAKTFYLVVVHPDGSITKQAVAFV